MAGPRFNGTLIEDEPAPKAGPRFSGTLIEDEPAPSVPGARESRAANATARGIVNGLPVVGPYVLGGIDRADAAVRSLTNDSRYSDEVAKATSYGEKTAAEHPWATTGGEIAGGIVGTLPMIAAAPAAFGAGAAGLGVRSLASAASGIVLGGADSAVRSDGDYRDTRNGAIAGGAFGLAGPAAGAAIGRGVGAAAQALAARGVRVPGMGNEAAGMISQDFRNSGGIDPVRTRMTELGQDAMLLDASPSFEGRAQGLAVLPDTREAVMAPIQARAREANARLNGDVNQHLGPTLDPAAFHAALDDAYGQAVPPLYQRALSQPVQVDTSNVLATIGRMGEAEKGGADMALRRAWGLLHMEAEVPGVGRVMVPDRRPEALHNAKEALDAMIATVRNQQGSAAASELRALSAARAGVNDALQAQVPGYAEANRTAQHFFQQREAFDRGQTLLNGGREAARPAQLAADTAAMTPEVEQAQRLGLRAEVDRHVGTTLNDRVALRRDLMGEGDYNRARMGTVFGDEPTAALANAVDREVAFDASHQRIVNNSTTEMRKRAADEMAPREVKPGPGDLGTVVAGAAGGWKGVAAAHAVKGARMAANAVGRESDLARNRQLAEAVTMRQGPELDTLVAALRRIMAAEESARQVGQATERGVQALALSQGDRAAPYIPFSLSPRLR